MSKYSKITKLPAIDPPPLPKPNSIEMNKYVKYSFKYFDLENGCFFPNTGCYDVKYLQQLLDRLKSISQITVVELLKNRSSSLRIHPIDWKDTSQINGFIHMKIETSTPYQLALSANEYGRIHGFFIDTTFYIVWLDKEHKLYP